MFVPEVAQTAIKTGLFMPVQLTLASGRQLFSSKPQLNASDSQLFRSKRFRKALVDDFLQHAQYFNDIHSGCGRY